MSSDVLSTLRSQIAAGDTTTALRDRFWTMGSGGSMPADVIDEISATNGGIVLTGATAPTAAREVRARRPDLPLLIAPTSADKHAATAERPFAVIDQDVLFAQPVEEVLDLQRRVGADMVVTPSGQIGAQDTPALKAVVRGANAITDPDVLTLVAVPSIWLSDPWVKTLCAVLRDSEHPVLLGLAHSLANPLDGKAAVAGYYQVAAEVGSVVGWRTDLSGLGFAANGGLGAAIGVRPSGRRYAQLGVPSRSSNKCDRTPHVLIKNMLRYTRTSHMQTEWFAQALPDVCDLPCCNGRPIDRFDDATDSVTAAHVHNSTSLYDLAGTFSGVAAPAREAWWRGRVHDALQAHAELGARLRREIPVPADLQQWSSLLSA